MPGRKRTLTDEQRKQNRLDAHNEYIKRKKLVEIRFRVTETRKAQIKKRAVELGKSVNQYMESLIDADIPQEGSNGD